MASYFQIIEQIAADINAAIGIGTTTEEAYTKLDQLIKDHNLSQQADQQIRGALYDRFSTDFNQLNTLTDQPGAVHAPTTPDQPKRPRADPNISGNPAAKARQRWNWADPSNPNNFHRNMGRPISNLNLPDTYNMPDDVAMPLARSSTATSSEASHNNTPITRGLKTVGCPYPETVQAALCSTFYLSVNRLWTTTSDNNYFKIRMNTHELPLADMPSMVTQTNGNQPAC